MPSYVHRLARRVDLPVIVDIYNSTVASREVTADTEPVSVASREAWFDEHTPERRPLWVIHDAEDRSDNPAVIGWMSYSNFYGRPAYSGTAELSIYIAENWRGRGIGKYCLEQAIAFAPEIRVHTLLGFIFGHNGASLALFRKFGFDTWAHFPRVANLDGVERDLIILGKRVVD
ncbi:N-acetyltransferase [Massilia sp. Dwa41.01b]|uniref:GNAT family N-acetyltransferase n=1 Tax=unclassified Massilia TaxID=2609279 RepID=UPI001601419B|nr:MULTISPECIES: GNAT family N-acetyltransferase [unclassified Massilia]QNA89045.1 N-acetyltransferase [Massilia sp. Dwa41.01b]QNA99933.1 N-acetyltransferase [Massilia sp. Se16.2.3]